MIQRLLLRGRGRSVHIKNFDILIWSVKPVTPVHYSIRDLRTRAVTVTDTESGKNHLILRLSQNYKYAIQIEKLFWS